MRQLQLPLVDMLGVAEAAERDLPLLPEFPAEQGMILCGMERWAEAICAFERSLQRYDGLDTVREDSYFTEAIAVRVRERLQRLYLVGRIAETSPVRITACYIVKDEAAVLERSLASIQGQVDDIVVVDTGSTDDTIAIAQRFDARVITHSWQESFSEARNAALAQADGDWIVFLDADEYFSEATCGNLRTIIETEQEAELLLISMRNIDAESQQELMQFYAPRIFRRTAGRSYEGRIHEELRQDGKLVTPIKRIHPQQLQIMHTGYAVCRSEQKAKRNLHLLLRELETATDKERLYMYLAESYDGLGQVEKAMLYAQKDIDTGCKSVTYASRSYRILLRLLSARPLEQNRRLATAQRAVADFPKLPDFHAEYAECLADALDLRGAVEEASYALHLAKDYDGTEPTDMTEDILVELNRRQILWQTTLANASKLKISACLIMRDEAKDLPVWLNNVKHFADECVIIDTGSTDQSIQLAEKAGYHVFKERWQQDFSVVRNQVMEQAQGSWLVMLDADERFAEPERVRLYLSLMDLTCPTIDAVMLPITHIDEDDGNREIKRAAHIRLIRRNNDLYYKGRVHEQLQRQSGILQVYDETHRLTIYHTGYSMKRMQKKLKRNLVLLQQEIAEQGTQPGQARYLADCYYGLGQYELAEHYARTSLQETTKSRRAQSDIYRLVLYCMKERRASLMEQRNFTEQAISRFPLLPDFYGWCGVLLAEYCQDNCMPEKQSLLEKAIELYEHPDEQIGEATQFADLADVVYAELASCYAAAGNQEKAELALQKSLSLNCHNETALDLFCTFRQERPAAELLTALQVVCGTNEVDIRYLARFAENHGWLDLLRELTTTLDQNFGIVLTNSVLLRCINQEKIGTTLDLAQEFATEIQKIPALLLKLEQEKGPESRMIYRRCIGMMPQAMQLFWQAYQGERFEAALVDAAVRESYALFFPAFLSWADESQMERFLQLVKGLPAGVLCQMAEKLVAARHWQWAVLASSGVAADAPEADSGFWCRLGICFYELRQTDTAQECLQRALELDSSCSEAKAFMEWNEEGTSC